MNHRQLLHEFDLALVGETPPDLVRLLECCKGDKVKRSFDGVRAAIRANEVDNLELIKVIRGVDESGPLDEVHDDLVIEDDESIGDENE